MRAAFLISASIVASGCAGPRPATTSQFYEQESRTTVTCMGAVNKLPPDQQMAVDPATGRSPYAKAVACYSSQIRVVVSAMQYRNAAQVLAFADYLVNLSEARDKGIIDSAAFTASYRQMLPLFKKSIVDADLQRESIARREFADRLAIFAATMSSITAEQERQRRASRPVNCVLTGIYRTTGMTCF